MDLFWQLLQAFFTVAVPATLLRGLWPRGAATEVAWARRRAEWISAACALVVTYLVLVVARALGGPEPEAPRHRGLSGEDTPPTRW